MRNMYLIWRSICWRKSDRLLHFFLLEQISCSYIVSWCYHVLLIYISDVKVLISFSLLSPAALDVWNHSLYYQFRLCLGSFSSSAYLKFSFLFDVILLFWPLWTPLPHQIPLSYVGHCGFRICALPWISKILGVLACV